MNNKNHLLSLVMEECAEIAKVASKAQRFGKASVGPTENFDNEQLMILELNDLLTIFKLLQEEEGFFPDYMGDFEDLEHQKKKRVRIDKYREYSKKIGTLDD